MFTRLYWHEDCKRVLGHKSNVLTPPPCLWVQKVQTNLNQWVIANMVSSQLICVQTTQTALTDYEIVIVESQALDTFPKFWGKKGKSITKVTLRVTKKDRNYHLFFTAHKLPIFLCPITTTQYCSLLLHPLPLWVVFRWFPSAAFITHRSEQ